MNLQVDHMHLSAASRFSLERRAAALRGARPRPMLVPAVMMLTACGVLAWHADWMLTACVSMPEPGREQHSTGWARYDVGSAITPFLLHLIYSSAFDLIQVPHDPSIHSRDITSDACS